MVSAPLESFVPILIFMAIGLGIYLGAILLSFLVRPSKPTQLKLDAYECGELPEGSAWSAFNIRFYVIALIFIIFDVESAVMFPVASVYKKMTHAGLGGIVLLEVLLFLGVLVAGIVYCWSKGDLDWVKSYSSLYQNKQKD